MEQHQPVIWRSFSQSNMNIAVCFSVVTVFAILLDMGACQNEEGALDDRTLHKHKKKRRPYQQTQSSPCGLSREATNEQDSRSLLAVLGGAAVGYHLGTKKQGQPIINNNIYNQYPQGGGGFPCGPLQSDTGFFDQGQSGLLSSHPILSNHFASQGGHGGFGGSRQTVNWDRTIRQFERHFVKPLMRWLK